MQARGPLMIEHRLIERMIAVIRRMLERIESTRRVDPYDIDSVVDFIRMYADRTHHGKEEDIMFRDLDGKSMSPDDRRMMDELIEDHVFGRKTTTALVDANNHYRAGDERAVEGIIENLRILVDFYPGHIIKEDKIFFPATRAYMTEAEEQAMLEEFREFNSMLIHEKYTAEVERLEGK